MFKHKATSIRTRHYLMVLAGLAAFFIATDACADNQIQRFNYTAAQSADKNEGTKFKFSRYVNNSLTIYENDPLKPNHTIHTHDDILPVTRLALEEFNLLPRVRFYLDLTEKKIEALSDKLRLKGEIPINNAGAINRNANAHTEKIRPSGRTPRKSVNSKGALSLLIPDRLKWNLSLDPNALNVFGKLNLNPHLNINGELGKTKQVGLYFKHTF